MVATLNQPVNTQIDGFRQEASIYSPEPDQAGQSSDPEPCRGAQRQGKARLDDGADVTALSSPPLPPPGPLGRSLPRLGLLCPLCSSDSWSCDRLTASAKAIPFTPLRDPSPSPAAPTRKYSNDPDRFRRMIYIRDRCTVSARSITPGQCVTKKKCSQFLTEYYYCEL